MRFELHIELGNDRMKTISDIVRALKKTAEKVAVYAKPLLGEGGRIMDENGNSVGHWEIVEPSSSDPGDT